MANISLKSLNRAHLVGIGGIGLSSIAKMLYLEGKKITGSDVSNSPVIESLTKMGIRVSLGHKASNLEEGTEVVIRSIAVSDDNLEIMKAKELKIPVISYPQALGLISSDKYTIAVSGTHGKTTTTAMISEVLSSSGLSPTVVVGSMLKKEKTNFIKGNSNLLVVESCEYKKSFLNINPNIIVITNIDNDHLDFYKDMGEIVAAFKEFASKLTGDDFLVTNLQDKNLKMIADNSLAKVVDYSSQKVPLKLKVLGDHNVENAKAAVSVAILLGVKEDRALESVANFEGTWRRMEFKGRTKKGFLVYDDYAHHPTEIKATLKALRNEFPNNKIVAVFQPHLFSRTKILINDFASSFSSVSQVVLAPIYKARESEDDNISSENLKDKINSSGVLASSFQSFEEIAIFLNNNLSSNDLVITIGAGDIYKLAESLIN